LTRAPRLRHLELTPDGYVAARIRGRPYLVPRDRELLVAVERLGPRGARRLLAALDEDVGRFHEVASVAEEVAERVFRGAISPDFRDVQYALRWSAKIGGTHGVGMDLALSFHPGERLVRGRWVDAVRYESEIVLWAIRWSQMPEPPTPEFEERERMLALYLRELAGILGVPEDSEAVLLYSNTLHIRAGEDAGSAQALDILRSLLGRRGARERL
jgi:hypothetical protein